jgi:hypothetical protein
MKEKSIVEKLGITPWPWRSVFCVDKIYRIHSEAITNIAEIGNGLNDKSDSSIIAAAPEMLEALIETCLEIESRYKIIGGFGTLGPVYTKNIKAIEKACYPKTWEQIKELL